MKRILCLAAAFCLTAGFSQADAFAAPFSYGDIFASVNDGQVRHYGPDGSLLETLSTGAGGITSGIGFDPGGNMYVSNHTSGSITRFSAGEGHDASLFGVNLKIKKPEGIIFDRSGNLWVGSGCCGDIKKLDADGNTVLSLKTGRRADWIQLSQDENKIYYTEDVHNGIRTLDIATGEHEAPLSSRYGFAQFQLLADGGVIAAHKGTVKRLDSLGKLAASYDVAGVDKWFALDLNTDEESFWALINLAVMSGFLGGKILFLIQYGPADFSLMSGYSAFGGFVSVPLAIAGFAYYWKKLPFLKLADYMFLTALFWHAFGRLGCFLAGCCYGRPTGLPWGVTFRDPRSMVPAELLGVRLHPVQLYEAAADLLIAFALYRVLRATEEGRVKPGLAAAVYFAAYGVLRSSLELLRADTLPFLGPLTQGQALGACLLAASAAVFSVVAPKIIFRSRAIVAFLLPMNSAK